MPKRKNPVLPNHKVAKGIIMGEGYPHLIKTKDKKEYTYPQLTVSMCDKKALQYVSEYWKTSIWRSGKGRCPRTPDNPEGYVYKTSITGKKAVKILQEPEFENTQIKQKAKERGFF